MALREMGGIPVLPYAFLVEIGGMARCQLIIAEERAIERGIVSEGVISRALGVGWGCSMEDDEDLEAA